MKEDTSPQLKGKEGKRKMTNKYLDLLVQQGVIKGYEYVEVNDDGQIVNESIKRSKFRNTEQLTLIFNNGHRLRLDTFCSGCAENTVLDILYSDLVDVDNEENIT